MFCSHIDKDFLPYKKDLLSYTKKTTGNSHGIYSRQIDSRSKFPR